MGHKAVGPVCCIKRTINALKRTQSTYDKEKGFTSVCLAPNGHMPHLDAEQALMRIIEMEIHRACATEACSNVGFSET